MNIKTRHIWSPGEVQYLLLAKSVGKTSSEIAKNLGVSRHAVDNKLYKIRLEQKQPKQNIGSGFEGSLNGTKIGEILAAVENSGIKIKGFVLDINGEECFLEIKNL